MKNLKTIYLLFFFCLFNSSVDAQCEGGSVSTPLSTGNITVHLPNNGSLWITPNYQPGYTSREPSDPTNEVGMILIGSLWMGGFAQSGELNTATATYASSANRPVYFPGPLDEEGQTNLNNCTNFDRQWSVSRTDIEILLTDFADGVIEDPIPPALLRWPAKGNPHFFDLFGFALPDSPQGLAPFFDQDGDGIYNPEKGDVPNIKAANQAVWWIFNDAGGLPIYTPLRIEVHAMAYSYASTDPEINTTTFYDFKMINRASTPIDSFYAALWIHPNLGCTGDDLIGCDSASNLAFVYNEEAFDGGPECGDCPGGTADFCGDIPMLGIKLLQGTDRIENGQIVNNGMSSFSYIDNYFYQPIQGMTDPQERLEYYHYLTGHWRDGTPMTYGGNGYNPLSPAITNYAFSSSPNDPNGWSLCTANPGFTDRRMLISSGPAHLESGSSTHLRFAVFNAYNNNYPCPSLDNLLAVSEKIDRFDGLMTGTNEPAELPASAIRFTPNPMTDYGVIRLVEGQDLLEQVAIYALDGSRLQVANGIQAKEWTVNREGLSVGMYLYRLQTMEGKWFSGKMIVQ